MSFLFKNHSWFQTTQRFVSKNTYAVYLALTIGVFVALELKKSLEFYNFKKKLKSRPGCENSDTCLLQFNQTILIHYGVATTNNKNITFDRNLFESNLQNYFQNYLELDFLNFEFDFVSINSEWNNENEDENNLLLLKLSKYLIDSNKKPKEEPKTTIVREYFISIVETKNEYKIASTSHNLSASIKKNETKNNKNWILLFDKLF